MTPPRHTLSVLAEPLTLVRLAPDAPVPAWADAPPFASITRTPHELSIICPTAVVPTQVEASTGWRALRVHGPLDLALIGVTLSIATPLAEACVSILPIATHDTDWILVRDAQLEVACAALREAGHEIA